MGTMSIQKSFKQDGRAIKAFTPSAAANAEIRYQNASNTGTDGQPSQSIFNFNQSPTAAS